MANHWYVSSVAGTASTATTRATTDITVQRTGAFSSMAAGDHFPDIPTCFLGDDTGKPTAGDIIYVANDHNATGLGTANIASATVIPVMVVSVLETACDQGYTGVSKPKESATDYNISTTGTRVHYNGIDITTTNDLAILASNNTCIIENSDITFTGSSDRISAAFDGSYFKFINCTLTWSAGTSIAAVLGPIGGLYFISAIVYLMTGAGAFTSDLIGGAGGSGGGDVILEECDLSLFPNYIWGNFGASNTADDNGSLTIKNCKLHASLTGFFNEELTGEGQRCLVTNSAATSAGAEYQFYQENKAGVVEDSGDDGIAGGIYRVESTAFSAGNKVSFKCTTDSNCSMGSPLMFEMPARFADLTLAGENEVTVYIATTATLNTSNTWIEVSYPDATNKHEWKTTSSRAADVLGEVTLTTDAGSDWENNGTDLTSENEYKITVTTVTGAVCVPTVRFFCTVPSITLYVDTTIDLS